MRRFGDRPMGPGGALARQLSSCAARKASRGIGASASVDAGERLIAVIDRLRQTGRDRGSGQDAPEARLRRRTSASRREDAVPLQRSAPDRRPRRGNGVRGLPPVARAGAIRALGLPAAFRSQRRGTGVSSCRMTTPRRQGRAAAAKRAFPAPLCGQPGAGEMTRGMTLAAACADLRLTRGGGDARRVSASSGGAEGREQIVVRSAARRGGHRASWQSEVAAASDEAEHDDPDQDRSSQGRSP